MESARSVNILAFVVTFALQTVSGEIIACGSRICRGSSPYCCILDDGSVGCCFDEFVYQMWWFWLIWVVIFFLIVGCALRFWRRRRTAHRYMVMNNSQYPTYGTVVHAAPVYTSPQGPTLGTPGVVPAATPVKPPSYSEATVKPPPYS